MTLYDKATIESSRKIEIKPLFEKVYKELLGNRYDEFMKYSFIYLRKCIRVNTIKISVENLQKRLEGQGWVLKQIPWCKEGFFVEGHKTEHRFDIGNLNEHVQGYFYVQEGASMIPPIALFQDLRPETDGDNIPDSFSDFRVLDMCAAPGSKTTQLAQYMNNQGVILAHDIDLGRLKPLSLNLQRMGVTNTLVVHNALRRFIPNKFNPEGLKFDRILVDAPCSGTGTIRKSFKVLQMYSNSLIGRLIKTQKTLIVQAFEMLAPGGVMVYSTCTLEPGENEGIVSYLLDKFPNASIEKINLNIVKSPAVLDWKGVNIREECKDCIRIYPQDNDSEGFFITRIRKAAE